MPEVTIRDLCEATHRAQRSAPPGTAEAEIRDVMEKAVNPPSGVKLGSALAATGREFGGVDLDVERDQTPAGTLSFE